MAKRKIIDDSLFKFENPKDTFKGYFIEIDKDGNYVFEGEKGGEFKMKEFPQLVKALDFSVNGKAVRDQEDLLIEIIYLGSTTKDGEPYDAYEVWIE